MTERCCLCNTFEYGKTGHTLSPLERTDLPGSGWRCIDRYACSQRVRQIIDAHKSLAEACEER